MITCVNTQKKHAYYIFFHKTHLIFLSVEYVSKKKYNVSKMSGLTWNVS